MLMQRFGEPAQDGLVWIGGDAVDDQLVAGDAERQRRAIVKEAFRHGREPRGGRLERGVSTRIDGVLVQRDRQFHQKRGQFA